MTTALPMLKIVLKSMNPVSLRSLDSFKSPNLRADFETNINPTASQRFAKTNTKTKERSNMPMYLPALSNESSSASPMRSDHGISTF